ncbi:developmentally-regulated GTP-binding protein 2 isoform X1 [Neomonachus schauinslandi]|uniref:Developmentally-regulated GTP-binding protein 2 isoform X1 n=1 Tax=Neomonachus schauinslandi TaxID=29088 RepID=A0A8M1MVG8_NEOSC|nr:developmentally-regulated GTP-binding protein 2 isoform X1 [Neomonachus schauinslandi]
MGILEKISEIEKEIARTQKNKATEYHLGLLKAKLAKYRAQLLEPSKSASSKGEGFDVMKSGDARVALIGFPSVGKSTFLSLMTSTASEAASYEFTTLTCIPGVIEYKGANIQLLDLPGIIEGAAQGKGRGRQVIAVARTADVFIDVIVGNRVYMPCLYVYNKIDQISMEEVDRLARKPNSVVISCGMKLNLDYLLEMLWEYLALTCIYTKKRGQRPDFTDAIILRKGASVEHVPVQVRAGVGHQHQVQPAAGGPDPHHGARGRHPDCQEVVPPAGPPACPPCLPRGVRPGRTHQSPNRKFIQIHTPQEGVSQVSAVSGSFFSRQMMKSVLGQRDMVGELGLGWWHLPRDWPLGWGFCVWNTGPAPCPWPPLRHRGGRLPPLPCSQGLMRTACSVLGLRAEPARVPGSCSFCWGTLGLQLLPACLTLGEGASQDKPSAPAQGCSMVALSPSSCPPQPEES